MRFFQAKLQEISYKGDSTSNIMSLFKRGSKRSDCISNSGLTLLELTIAVAILIALILLLSIRVPSFILRARDAERRSDLEEYRIALEEYFTDHGIYPPETILDDPSDCNSANLQPYMTAMECDPVSQQPYHYVVSDDGQDYWMYAFLYDIYDTERALEFCDGGNCADEGMYNYGISSRQVGSNNNAPPADGESGGVFPPYCGGSCNPGVCGECCPGAKTRCDSSGVSCYSDATCG